MGVSTPHLRRHGMLSRTARQVKRRAFCYVMSVHSRLTKELFVYVLRLMVLSFMSSFGWAICVTLPGATPAIVRTGFVIWGVGRPMVDLYGKSGPWSDMRLVGTQLMVTGVLSIFIAPEGGSTRAMMLIGLMVAGWQLGWSWVKWHGVWVGTVFLDVCRDQWAAIWTDLTSDLFALLVLCLMASGVWVLYAQWVRVTAETVESDKSSEEWEMDMG